MAVRKPNEARIVINVVGVTAPNGNNLTEFQKSLLTGKSGIQKFNIRYMGEILAGIFHFDPLKYQKRRNRVGEQGQALLPSTVPKKQSLMPN